MISSSSSQTQSGAGDVRSTPSISSDSVFVSSEQLSLSPDPEIEGECILEFTIRIPAYGVYERVEVEVAKNLMDTLRLKFGEDTCEVKDEAGRKVVYKKKATGMNPKEIIIVREGF
jgi:hypothetical protein